MENNLTCSPDGRLLASTGGGRLRLWDRQSGQLVRAIDCPSQKDFEDGLFSADGKTVLVVDGQVCRWFDTSTGAEVCRCQVPLPDEWNQHRFVALAPNGEAIALRQGEDIVLYDLPSGLERHRWSTAGAWEGWLAFAPRGRLLAAVERDPVDGSRVVRLLDNRKAGSEVEIELTEDTRSFCFSGDGRFLAAYGLASGTVYVWAVPDGKLLHRLQGSTALRPLAFAPDGTVLAFAGPDAQVVLVEPVSGRKLRRIQAHLGVRYVFAPDSKTLIVWNRDGAMTQWDSATGQRLSISADPPARCWSLQFSGDGERLSSWAGEFREVHWRSGVEVRRWPDPGNGWEPFVALSPDGTRLARPKSSHELGVWDTRSRKELLAIPAVRGGDYRAWGVPDFSPDGHTLYFGGLDRMLTACDVESGRMIPVCAEEFRDAQLVKVSPSGRFLAVTVVAKSAEDAEGCEVVVWDLRDRCEKFRFTPCRGPHRVNAIAFSADERLVAAVGGRYRNADMRELPYGSGVVAIFDTASGKQVQLQGSAGEREAPLAPLSREPAGRDNFGPEQPAKELRTWTFTDRDHPISTIARDWVNAVAFAPDGRTLATGDGCGIVRLWDLTSGHERRAFTDRDSPVWALAFCPDGRHLASGGFGPAVVWDVTDCHHRSNSDSPFADEEKDRSRFR